MRATRDEAHPLLEARAVAAQALDDAIEALGVAMATFASATDDVESATGATDLLRYLETTLVGQLAAAGFGPYLERKLPGSPVSLRDVVERQHLRMIAPLLGR